MGYCPGRFEQYRQIPQAHRLYQWYLFGTRCWGWLRNVGVLVFLGLVGYVWACMVCVGISELCLWGIFSVRIALTYVSTSSPTSTLPLPLRLPLQLRLKLLPLHCPRPSAIALLTAAPVSPYSDPPTLRLPPHIPMLFPLLPRHHYHDCSL